MISEQGEQMAGHDAHAADHRGGGAEHEAERAAAVKKELLRHTESAGIDVQVDAREDGHVRLHGVVDTLAQKKAAEEIARQASGVRTVENGLAVHVEKERDAEVVRRTLAGRFARHPRMEGVSAEVVKGVVTLRGHVETAEDEQEAMTMAMGAAGVKEVNSYLKVGVGRDDDDAAVGRKARQVLAEAGLDPGQFTLWCDAGRLFIRGLVDSEETARRIRRLVGGLDGVAAVDALLPVDPDAAGARGG